MEKLFDKSYGITSDSPADVSTLEITMKIGCSIQCKYCPQNLLIREYNKISKKIEMSFNTFKTCIDTLPLTTIVCFAGFSEPFYTKEAVTMMKYAAKEREVSLFTTLVGLDEKQIDEQARNLLQGILYKIEVSYKDYQKVKAIEQTEEQ